MRSCIVFAVSCCVVDSLKVCNLYLSNNTLISQFNTIQTTLSRVMARETSATDETAEVTNPFHPSLVRQMLQASRASVNNADNGTCNNDNQKITNEALVATGEVLRLFVQEAWHRASIEAECEYEGVVEDTTNDDHDTSNIASAIGNQTKITTTAPIRPDHITKIAAELLMDFS